MDYYLAVLLFSFVCAITPGPNNFMLMASGLNHGVKKTLPHYLGCVFGFAAMLSILGIGLASVFIKYPVIHVVLKSLGICFMLFLAWKIANAGNPDAKQELKAPLTFLQGATFQWVNPKGVVFAVSVIAAYTSQETIVANLIFIVLANIVVGACSLAVWLILGQTLQKFIQSKKQILYFNLTMAFLLMLSVVPILTLSIETG